jgi:hypothetical protein
VEPVTTLALAALLPSVVSIVRKLIAGRDRKKQVTVRLDGGDGAKTIDISDASQAEAVIKEFLAREGFVGRTDTRAEDETRRTES